MKNIYLCCPKKYYGKEIHNKAIGYLNALDPKVCTFIDPAPLFPDQKTWEDKFPEIVKDVNYCLVASDEDMVVGKGCFHEIRYFQEKNIPIVFLNKDNSLSKVKSVKINNLESFIEYARIILYAEEKTGTRT